ncbi:hypothetical protein DITRI_Ditri01bG0149900 [Diplodiscus trichospermus]
MQGLKILDLSDNLIESLPNSISKLKTLTALMLRFCTKLEKVPSFSEFQALKMLDLRRTNIKDIPHGIEKLVNLKYLDLSGTSITEMTDGILGKLTSLQHLETTTYFRKGDILVRGEELGGLSKLEFFKGRFYYLKELNRYAQAVHARRRGPRQYRIDVGNQPEEEYDLCSDSEQYIELRGCCICTDGVKIMSDVKDLIIVNCMIVDLCEEEAFFSRFIIPVPHNFFSSLSRIEIFHSKSTKKLFLSNGVLGNLQNLKFLYVVGCEEIEEIIASESELEEEGASSFKFTLPKLCWLELCNLPALKSICGANGVVICDSIVQIDIINCPELKRIPLNLPLQDDGQPSPPPCLETICISSEPEEWWQLVEWDHPSAKSLLEPYILKW